ncbi:MAG: hypothetical protein WCT53_03080 [Candidatus Gracilibacteria bacterium]
MEPIEFDFEETNYQIDDESWGIKHGMVLPDGRWIEPGIILYSDPVRPADFTVLPHEFIGSSPEEIAEKVGASIARVVDRK